MADIELVIKLNEDIYKQIKGVCGYTYIWGGRGCGRTAVLSIPLNAIRKGIPLPKGHKIIDATALQEHLALVPMEDRTFRETVDIIDWFPSIIEADKE